MIEWLERHIEWSRRTFGNGRRHVGIIKHIQSELLEIEQSPGDLMEWVDVVILALDGAWRCGHTVEEIIAALDEKQQINFARQWPVMVDDNEPSNHLPT